MEMVTQVFQSTLGTGIRKLRLADVVNLLEEFADPIACVPRRFTYGLLARIIL